MQPEFGQQAHNAHKQAQKDVLLIQLEKIKACKRFAGGVSAQPPSRHA
jgi:hypothetical protein